MGDVANRLPIPLSTRVNETLENPIIIGESKLLLTTAKSFWECVKKERVIPSGLRGAINVVITAPLFMAGMKMEDSVWALLDFIDDLGGPKMLPSLQEIRLASDKRIFFEKLQREPNIRIVPYRIIDSTSDIGTALVDITKEMEIYDEGFLDKYHWEAKDWILKIHMEKKLRLD